MPLNNNTNKKLVQCPFCTKKETIIIERSKDEIPIARISFNENDSHRYEYATVYDRNFKHYKPYVYNIRDIENIQSCKLFPCKGKALLKLLY